jgi:hypothetical protein
MKDLEKELGLALRREEPPDGFAERVLERVAAERPETSAPRRGRGGLYGLAAAAAVTVFAFGAWRAASPPAPPAPPAGQITEVAEPHAPPPVVAPPSRIETRPNIPQTARATPRTPSRRATSRRVARRPAGPSLAEARRAKEDLMLALRIASDRLGATRRMVLEARHESGS